MQWWTTFSPSSTASWQNDMKVLGIDVGTTGTKTVVADEKGRILACAYKEYELSAEGGGRVSQNAEDWWDAVMDTVKRSVLEAGCAGEIEAIGLSTQGASMLACDREGRPLCPVITWMDSRSEKEISHLKKVLPGDTVYRKCGWPLSPAGDASKILWIKNALPDVFEKAACFPSTVEFVNYRLTGRFVADPTNAAIRQLFNIETGTWDEDILNAVGITKDRLPEIVPVGELVGELTEDAARALGLRRSVKVFSGAHDQYCASLGSGACSVGDMLLATGTAWVVLGITEKLLYTESHISPGIHPSKGAFGAMASLVSAGSALKWYRGIIDGDYKEIDREAEKRLSSSKDMFVLPYVAGAGFPHNRPNATATVTGLTLGTDRYDIARAFMEGVAFEARSVLEEFSKEGMKITSLMMTGGAAKSPLWSSIVGYVTGCDIYLAEEEETCCAGASMLALVGLGAFPDLESCSRATVKKRRLELNDTGMTNYYNEKYERYKALREQLI